MGKRGSKKNICGELFLKKDYLKAEDIHPRFALRGGGVGLGKGIYTAGIRFT